MLTNLTPHEFVGRVQAHLTGHRLSGPVKHLFDQIDDCLVLLMRHWLDLLFPDINEDTIILLRGGLALLMEVAIVKACATKYKENQSPIERQAWYQFLYSLAWVSSENVAPDYYRRSKDAINPWRGITADFLQSVSRSHHFKTEDCPSFWQARGMVRGRAEHHVIKLADLSTQQQLATCGRMVRAAVRQSCTTSNDHAQTVAIGCVDWGSVTRSGAVCPQPNA